MNKKSVIFIIVIFSIAIITLGIILIINGPKWTKGSGTPKESKTFFLILIDDDEPYYIITGLKDTKQKIIEIPNTIDNIPVQKIVDSTNKNFITFKDVTKIIIPNNILYIGTSMDDNGIFNDGTLGDSFFLSATSLQEIEVSDGNQVYASENGILYSKNKEILLKFPVAKSVDNSINYTINDHVKTIYQRAFYLNTGVHKITLGKNVEIIQSEAFSRSAILQEVIFNNTLQEISANAFANCAQLISIILPNSLIYLGNLSFAYCPNLQNVYMPADITYIGVNVFSGCQTLSKVTTDNVNVIESYRSRLALSNSCQIIKNE